MLVYEIRIKEVTLNNKEIVIERFSFVQFNQFFEFSYYYYYYFMVLP